MYLKVVEKQLRQKFQHEFRVYTRTYKYMDMSITIYLSKLSQVIPVWEKEREGAFIYIWHVKK